MTISRLDIVAVRNIRQATLYPAPTLNFIYGANASGKSALIEALFILGRARSFRALSNKPVIQFSADHLLVTAHTVFASGAHQQLGVRLDAKSCEIRINQQTQQNKSSLAYCFPLQLIYPKSYELLDGGPQQRREFLDWGVFHHDPTFLAAWRNYKKALLQRNALLKTRQTQQLQVWNQELASYGTIVTDCRRRYLQAFIPIFTEIAEQLLPIPAMQLTLMQGWDNSRSLLEALAGDTDKDVRYGFTQSGPHRADIALSVERMHAKDVISRGQLKLLVICLKLAQVQLLNQTSQQTTVLFDDFSAELDLVNRAIVLNFLTGMQCQAFITAISPADFGDLSNQYNYKMFHVEHGAISPVDCSM